MANQVFHVADYLVFGATMLLSIAIGIYHAFAGDRQRTTSEYLMGGRKMKFFPVAISLMVSFESSIMMLGLPAESYVYGLQYIWCPIGYFVAVVLGAFVIVPVLYPLKLTTAYEYLEMRFQSKYVRTLGNILFVINTLFYMGIVLFGPAVALEKVTGFPQWVSIVFVASSAMIYTSIGGFKAVIWTDVFQSVIMITGILAILIKGTVEVGSPKRVWDIAERGGRMNFFNFDPDPTIRHTFWSLFIGSMIRGSGLLFNQQTIQRISSTSSIEEARKVIGITAPCFPLALIVSAYEGIVAYAYYFHKECDPLESGELTNPNQIIPYVVLDLFESYQGLSGLFLASLFSACLSTLSSALSGLSGVVFKEIIQPLSGNISELKATFITKMSVVVFGAVACGIAFLVSNIGSNLNALASGIMGAFSGPAVGLFLLCCYCPRVNAKGALAGGIFSLIFGTWISMGMNFSPSVKKAAHLPPASINNCSTSYANITSSNITEDTGEIVGVEVLYNLSYMWLGPIGTVSCMVVAMVVSGFVGFNKPGDVDPRYLVSVIDTLLFFLPSKIRKHISSIGPQFMDKKHLDKFANTESSETKGSGVLELKVNEEKANKMTRVGEKEYDKDEKTKEDIDRNYHLNEVSKIDIVSNMKNMPDEHTQNIITHM